MTELTMSASPPPLLTCIVASYNHGRYIAKGIEACLRIPIASKEIIVIDDGSTDGSVDIIRDVLAGAGANIDVRLIARSNHGLVSSLNHALSQARGEFVFMIASDDLAFAQGIVTLVQALQAKPSAALAFGNSVAFVDEDEAEESLVGYPTYGHAHREFFALVPAERERALFLDYPNPLLIQATVFRRDALARIGNLDATLVLDDYPLFIRLLRQHPIVGEDVLFLPDIFASAYRQHAANSHRNLVRQMDVEAQIMERLCPPELKPEALARRYMHFGLRSLRNRHWKASLKMGASAVAYGPLRAGAALVREARRYRSRPKAADAKTGFVHPCRLHG